MFRSLLTVQIASTEKQQDMELPSNMPLEELGKLILLSMDELLDGTESLYYEASIGDGEWRTLNSFQSLTENNVMDGSILKLDKC